MYLPVDEYSSTTCSPANEIKQTRVDQLHGPVINFLEMQLTEEHAKLYQVNAIGKI